MRQRPLDLSVDCQWGTRSLRDRTSSAFLSLSIGLAFPGLDISRLYPYKSFDELIPTSFNERLGIQRDVLLLLAYARSQCVFMGCIVLV